MKLNATNRSTLKAIAVVVILLVVIMFMATPADPKMSMYQPREITVKAKSDASIFTLPRSTECLAGPEEKSDFYNIDVQGICGGQQLVSDHASYEISDGIGGVLI
tara:strand:+ start:781 stop:1095 length:315 start_codon:yes stop_codon:yes gene_type:complete